MCFRTVGCVSSVARGTAVSGITTVCCVKTVLASRKLLYSALCVPAAWTPKSTKTCCPASTAKGKTQQPLLFGLLFSRSLFSQWNLTLWKCFPNYVRWDPNIIVCLLKGYVNCLDIFIYYSLLSHPDTSHLN